MRKASLHVLLLSVLAVGAAAVAFGQAPESDPEHAAKMRKGTELFKQKVRAILVEKCVKCHGDKHEGGLDITDRAGLLKGGETGPAILPGRGKESLLYQLASHKKEPHMPHNRAKLPDAAIEQLAQWIDLGAPYDEPLIAKKVTGPKWTEKTVAPDARNLWSLQPLARHEPPAVKNAAWCRTPIDRFVLARQEAAGISPNAVVDRRLLIRRACFDLLGLPPTAEQVDDFLRDPAPDAYGKLLDRLLASKHFGERWARHWLDVARFAESHGFEHDYDRPTAYPYRDFVIQAMNADLPYDRFVKWQIAGDEFEPQNNLALMATGFLAAGPHSTQITKREVEKHRYDEMDDMLATTGTSMLGLTIGCARCHDHKFDPIPQADYYRLLASFTTTVRSEVDLDMDPSGYRAAKAAFDKKHAPLEAARTRYELEKLPGRLAAWESESGSLVDRLPWIVAEPASSKSAGGATFTKKDDGSLLVSGKKPQHDTYTFVVHAEVQGIRALRVEALADPSFPKSGPGRADNGNFALTSLRVTAAPRQGKAEPQPVALRNARATFEQKGLPVASAIDGKGGPGWAVDPQFGKDHAATFEFDKPVGFDGGATLTIVMEFKNNTAHSIGRPRLSLSTRENPPLTGENVTQAVLATLKNPAEKRTPEQTAQLLKWHRTRDPEWRRLDQIVQDHLRHAPKPTMMKTMISTEGLQAVRLHTQGEDFLPTCHFLKRGDPEQKDGVADQGFLQVLMRSQAAIKPWQEPAPAGWRTSYRRRALANWLTDVDNGAGGLLARVIVNRLWQHHMGRGIVSTPNDFGTRGELPSHPELLDWLAQELIRNGWRLKPIHKQIMLSAAYMQSSATDEARARVDRENRLLWHKPLHRLEAEIIRDSLLAVGGVLDDRMFGPGTLDDASRRRSIYFTVKRSKLLPMMQVFDAPEALVSIGERPTTTIAPQALLLMNNPQVRAYAKAFAKRVAPTDGQGKEGAIRKAYLTALAREPSPEEKKDAEEFLGSQTESYRSAGKADAGELALADFCQALMLLNEFVYIE